ncbi:hypothetical protein CYMTET_3863 [Cymbomonas tetramitiformis]|uniref:Uncharacterized protein n=1 Tax=Cymbomonas tetramitiformis TaxID=36881 RepID=A0AAE0H2Q7_9CHLO|nr:hypothetical protein CYMTET_6684 [Cymbomonas tetramitiformis]KAK3288645.1 hypothetical protein CYMTET_3863 [Cymbomonas tetramitiformis]
MALSLKQAIDHIFKDLPECTSNAERAKLIKVRNNYVETAKVLLEKYENMLPTEVEQVWCAAHLISSMDVEKASVSSTSNRLPHRKIYMIPASTTLCPTVEKMFDEMKRTDEAVLAQSSSKTDGGSFKMISCYYHRLDTDKLLLFFTWSPISSTGEMIDSKRKEISLISGYLKSFYVKESHTKTYPRVLDMNALAAKRISHLLRIEKK